MFSRLVKQMIIQEDDGEKKYQVCHLRRQAIVHFLHHHEEDEYKDWIIKEIKQLYGSHEEGGLGPFSVKLYLQHIVKNGSWEDNIILFVVWNNAWMKLEWCLNNAGQILMKFKYALYTLYQMMPEWCSNDAMLNYHYLVALVLELGETFHLFLYPYHHFHPEIKS